MSETVLLIDDDPNILDGLGARFEAAGYRTIRAMDGAQGLAVARSSRPHAIVLDLRMPRMDGFEVCRRLKRDVALSDTPIIVFSANAGESVRQSALDAGACRFIPKPFRGIDIVAAVRQAIDEHNRQVQAAEACDNTQVA